MSDFDEKMKEEFISWVSSPEDDQISFDPYAQDINRFSFLQERIPGLIISSAGGFYPFQLEGLLHDYFIYGRSEDGYSSLFLALEKEDVYLDALYYSSVEGEFNPDNWEEMFVKLVINLKRAPGLYEFEAFEPKYVDHNWVLNAEGLPEVDRETSRLRPQRGNTPEEAYASLFTIDEYFLQMFKMNAEQYRKFIESLEPQFPPAVTDQRVFPEEDPMFTDWIRWGENYD